MIINISYIANSVTKSIDICLSVLIPSLFIFLVISDLLIKTKALNIITKPFGKLFGFLFKVDSSFGPLIISSLLCGYPVGAKLIKDLTESKQISEQTASRLLCFCVNAGPAFLIGSVAAPLFGSNVFGFILLISHFIAFLIVGILSGINKKKEICSLSSNRYSFDEALVLSVNSGIKSMAMICGFVIIFFAILTLLFETTALKSICSPFLNAVISGLLEVSSGVEACKKLPLNIAFPLVSGITAFGGICVHLQIRALTKSANISMKPFLIWRFVYATISLAISLLALQFIDIPSEVFLSQNATAKAFSTTPISSILLIILSLTLLCCDKKADIMKLRLFPRKDL